MPTPNPSSGPKKHNINTMTLFDKNNTPVRDGEYVKDRYGEYYQLQGNGLYIVCESGHPCKGIPYAFIPELYEKVLHSEVKAAPVIKYPTRQSLDSQTKEPITHSITIGNLWVDVNSQAFYFTIANPEEVDVEDSLIVLTHVQAATLRDFITTQLKPPL